METVLLEDWLHRAVFSSSPPPSSPSKSSSPSAQQIAQAWSQVRECARTGLLLPQHSAALALLREYGYTIHVVDSQARLLVSILSKVTSSSDAEENVVAHARSSAALLLSIWLRRGFTSAAGHNTKASSSQLQEIFETVVTSTIKESENSTPCVSFVNEAILLLGSMCVNRHVREEQRRACQEAIARECIHKRKCIGGEKCKEALAGMGYAMISSSRSTLKVLMEALLLLWTDDDGVDHKGSTTSTRPSLENGLLHLHLMEWYGSYLASQPKHSASLQIVVDEITGVVPSGNGISARYGVLLSAAGLLRSFHLRPLATRPASWESIVQLLNSSIVKLIDDTTLFQVNEITEAVKVGTFVNAAAVKTQKFIPANDIGEKHWLQCISVAMSRCSRFSSSLSLLVCVTTAFFEEVFPLRAFYNGAMPQTPGQNEDALTMHVKGILFHEAGAIFRVICEQYELADIRWQSWIEYLFSDYSHFIYTSHRFYFSHTNSRKHNGYASSLSEIDKGSLKKILEAALLSLVLFFSRASKKKINADVHAKGQFAARVMNSLSCIEFIRQGQVPEYRDLVQRCVTWVSTSESSCAMLLSMFPAYDEIIQQPGPGISSYSWKEDSVQDSRVLFGFRVLPTLLQTFPPVHFSTEIAPIMFLYMKHPIQALVQSSHSLLVSFLSTKSSDGNRDSIKEQLAVQFIKRTFEDDSTLPNYDVFVTVVGAIARHLPAGSRATRECITFLSRKASELFSLAARTGEEDRLETAKKLQTLLLHLILIVDVQVLPHLLQEVARLVLGQRNPHRTRALEEAFDVLAGSDDLTRKHVLVPWLQSLSYLCSNSDEQRQRSSSTNSKRRKRRTRGGFNNEVGQGDGAVAFNPSSATMCAESEANDTAQTSRSRL